MGKFVLKELVENAKQSGLKHKAQVLLNAKSMSKEAFEKIYSIYFWSLNGFIFGNPTKWQVYGWRIYVISGIDTEFNKESQDRAKRILKDFKRERIVFVEDKNWIQKELKPYFEESLKKQTGKTIGMLDAVNENKMQEFLNKIKNEKEGRFK